MPSCLTLFRHAARLAVSRALLSAGKSMLAKIDIMATTTKSSIKVKSLGGLLGCMDIPSGLLIAVFISHSFIMTDHSL